MKKCLTIFWLIAVLTFTTVHAISGKVFLDSNANGIFDEDEIGLPNCYVSDGREIVATNEDGDFFLDTNEPFIFIILPDEYACRRWYSSTNERQILFALTKSHFSRTFAVVSDIHYAENPEAFSKALTDRSMKYNADKYLEKLIQSLNKQELSFVLVLGDIGASIRDIDDQSAKDQLGRVASYMNRIKADVFYAIGNHEFKSKAERPTGIFEATFGPRYYSFNRSGIHFIVLDIHLSDRGSLKYEIDSVQLKWLEKDLTLVPNNQPIVVFSHEPLYDLTDSENNRELKKLFIDYQITAHISGHWHTMIKLSDYPYLELTCGAVCGAWWEGPSPSGDEFGYVLFETCRNVLNYAYININEDLSIWLEFPFEGVLSGLVPIRVVTSKFISNVAISIDGKELSFKPIIVNKDNWVEYLYRLNLTNLAQGMHEFVFKDTETQVEKRKSFWVSNRSITFKILKDYPECFLGKLVTVDNAKFVAKSGSVVSFYDGTDGMMVKFSNPNISNTISDSAMYSLTGVVRDPWVVADPLRIHLDEGIIQR